MMKSSPRGEPLIFELRVSPMRAPGSRGAEPRTATRVARAIRSPQARQSFKSARS